MRKLFRRKKRAREAALAREADERLDRAAAEIKAELRAERFQQACRLANQAQDHGAFDPSGHESERRLAAALGEHDYKSLIRAFAAHRCFYCSRGLERCEECDGSGHDSAGLPCERCAGLGVVRCPYCGGSGLVAGEYIIPALRQAAMSLRMKSAIESLKSLLGEPPLDNPQTASLASIREAMDRLIRFDRIRAVLANALETRHGPPSHDASGRRGSESSAAHATSSGVSRICRRLEGEIVDHMTSILTWLQAAWRARAATTPHPQPDKRETYLARARHFGRLARAEHLKGTPLDRPALRKLIA